LFLVSPKWVIRLRLRSACDCGRMANTPTAVGRPRHRSTRRLPSPQVGSPRSRRGLGPHPPNGPPPKGLFHIPQMGHYTLSNDARPHDIAPHSTAVGVVCPPRKRGPRAVAGPTAV